MPRIARKDRRSFTNLYHIIIKGINSQDIFLDDQDRKKFIIEVVRTKEIYNYEIYAYVLMNNHVHMLIYDKKNNLSKVIQGIATSYAMYFNKKYERIGHVFYNRFKSKCVEDETYLLNLQRYIHKNPEKDGICRFDKYNWSSYNEYIRNKKIVDTEFILRLFDENSIKAKILFKEFNEANSQAQQYTDETEFELEKTISDESVIKMINTVLEIENVIEIQNYSKNKISEIVNKIYSHGYTNIAQISRIVGINKRMAYRMINKDRKGVSPE